MSELPYKFTICPPNDPPKQYTAMTQAMVNAMRHGRDLTIDQRAFMYPCISTDFEGRLRDELEKIRGEK